MREPATAQCHERHAWSHGTLAETLELSILGEQKSAKIIALLEEMRRDNPLLKNRVDHGSAAMAVAADPQAVLDAIKEFQDLPLVSDLLAQGGPSSDVADLEPGALAPL